MPFLSDQDREAARNRHTCDECLASVTSEYCSQCDTFYQFGHGFTCSLADTSHAGHRRKSFVLPKHLPKECNPNAHLPPYTGLGPTKEPEP